MVQDPGGSPEAITKVVAFALIGIVTMFSKNEHETERHPIRFIQAKPGMKYLGKDKLYLMTNETASRRRGGFRTKSEKELTDSLAVKYPTYQFYF